MTAKPPSIPFLPVSSEELSRLQSAISDFSPHQLAWLSGYFWGMVNHQPQTEINTSVVPVRETVTLLSASQTGNACRLAEQLRDSLQAVNLNVNLINAGDYKFKQISQERVLIIIVSTQGEGEPAEEAVALHKYLHSKKAPSMKETVYAVFGLGDTSYENFCQAGKDFDARLSELGAQCLLERVDADVEYQEQAEQWRQKITDILKQRLSAQEKPTIPTHSVASPATLGSVNESLKATYTKEKPLTASLLTNQKITGQGSDKDVRHIEIDLGNSGLSYQPGDALGIWYENDPALVDELITLLWLDGSEPVSVHDKLFTLREALISQIELTQNTGVIVEKYAALAKDEKLLGLVADKQALQQYAQQKPIVDMVREFASHPEAQQFIDLLRPLTPRLYSISSSQSEVENEVHITVGVVRYEIEERVRTGGASGYLADRLQEDDNIRIFIEPNNNFRLPANPNTPVIMIGPGTGIAPFRAFLQQRDSQGAEGKNWLFFGNPHFIEDFLYQVEFQRYVKEGLLTRIDLAWSRDQQNKIYVQNKLYEQGAEIWRWIQDGAHLYVCGDANRMAKDVEQTLLDIISQQGGMDVEQADEFLSELRFERRYQRDVY
ncbi:NADPH-dependent assimilatory sulfite reductase flavoprotein subunit [Xenorhabdus nematophila]|uniref:NADPH-dependent assimilatory sulfite reductase flavoprotein subunit n=1 Tax=Xenorhabdus nematophila TaxID=628 RepID=UPI000543401D|nr:NADPH-dependent assimilatory sulfite reductase flavoprotein subunit [Xenorhabdus nematophila]CEF28846.1 sulfite reductase, alpha subunit (flavoprotein) [Xenorhabdus nematophila str. Websteri]AYA42270.1 NADPH-dependent assimilatory sulfite reductase flavoprotein subunit [Xenorhabdus nematophila]KHD28899.1 sulfite reductase subunit alpha [Xenorhabdus nematophila]MBA0020996.1 NADPH-dependent assimilatory sulfite reductase flavoprotein subunit [Xenorhabdus nematophila]MCB4425958.1 NADPH-depende